MDEQTARYYHQKRIAPTRALLKHLAREKRAKERLKEKKRYLDNCHQALRKCRADLNLSNMRADDLARWIDRGRQPKSAMKTGKGRRKSRGGRRRINRRKTKRRRKRRRKKRRRKRTRKGGKIYSRRTKRMRPYVIVKIDRDPVNYKQKGGFLGDALGGLAKTAMGAMGGDMGGLAKTAMGALGGDMGGLEKMGKDILGRAKGGLMDKIGGFAGGLGGGGGLGDMMGKFSGGSVSGENLLSGEPSVKLESCDPSERPEYPKGPDGCGKHESPKATVQQLKQGFVDDSQVYQLEEY